jgi:hypothetical protein
MVSQVHVPPSGGASSSFATILIIDVVIGISTRAKTYDQPECHSTTKETPSTSQPDSSLTLEKPFFKLTSRLSKATFHQTTHNFNTRVAQHYNSFKDLA